ncbi:FHA domain-containing protein [Chitinophaga sp. sic0106]|uniref:FHA domain-containing protein n=1 Tax=Chitinophaga sp. sic0106 TaxID=2854785 RepID=UPI001C481B87|nr:FHA domain-containing protein [Chitinophaga sp. sic0106]MBV7533920.1 FHA domain-containing protein [Chitinophaga sp. sic0106]
MEKIATPIGIRLTNQVTNRYFELKFFNAAHFGREKMGKSIFTDSTISRNHCMIKLIKNDYWVVDVGSTYGTFVNVNGEETACTALVQLQNGGTLKLATIPFLVEYIF